MEGFIKLHRKTLKGSIFKSEKALKVFIWCLLKASHTEHDQIVGNQVITLLPGQFIFGRKQASIELQMPESTVYKTMELLKNNNSVNSTCNNKFSLVTVINWELYQSQETISSSKRNNNGTGFCNNKTENRNNKISAKISAERELHATEIKNCNNNISCFGTTTEHKQEDIYIKEKKESNTSAAWSEYFSQCTEWFKNGGRGPHPEKPKEDNRGAHERRTVPQGDGA